ncbi:hypothetical protein B0H17DRAFT_223575 [Mycena rosella]|uniref:Uncharacterized protein n=1 Tax=Mycena rosella TaxID=1033263 RepID=A0AAD7CX02_MYCRO|nr:hypothetical protein B0H17DRAFT_223575 [Mycena rosella]
MKLTLPGFSTTPQHVCSLFRICGLKVALKSVGWQINHLAPEMRVLAYSACALASSISFDIAITGPSPQPESFADRSVFYPGADFRSYGVGRAPMFHALRERAISLACETRIQLEV